MEYHLFVTRHAEDEMPDFKQNDFDRALTRKGVSEAEQAGKWILNSPVQPSLIVCSSARRTLQTARIIASLIHYNPDRIKAYSELYNCSSEKMIDILSIQEETIKSILVVGHNPSIADVISTLTGAYKGNVATGSVHYLCFDIQNWPDLYFTTGKAYLKNNSF